MPSKTPNYALWEELIAHLQERATASINVFRDSESGLRFMIVSTDKEMAVAFVPERNAVRWETANEYGFERMQEPIERLAVDLMLRFSRYQGGTRSARV